MQSFSHKSLLIFFTAMGIVLGGSLIGSLAAVVTGNPPLLTARKLAEEMKLWAVVAALGGTFSSIEVLGSGFFTGQIRPLIKQLLFIIAGLAGAESAKYLVFSLTPPP